MGDGVMIICGGGRSCSWLGRCSICVRCFRFGRRAVMVVYMGRLMFDIASLVVLMKIFRLSSVFIFWRRMSW